MDKRLKGKKERTKRDCKGKTVCWIRMEAGDKGPAGPSGG